MRERGGRVLNVASIAAFQPVVGLGVYAATKAYVTSLSEALHAEVNGSGVHVTALCPGLTKTEFQDHSNTTGLAARIPDLAWTSVEQVASTGLNDVASNKTISVPGLLYKSAVTVSDVMPRSVTRMVSGLITR
jgi:hypothetical protein